MRWEQKNTKQKSKQKNRHTAMKLIGEKLQKLYKKTHSCYTIASKITWTSSHNDAQMDLVLAK